MPDHKSSRRAEHPGALRPIRRVGLALRYTVQPDDTMDEVAVRFGFADYRLIWRLTRSLPQPVAGPITDPDRIWPGQILLIPLPSPALRLAGRWLLEATQLLRLEVIADPDNVPMVRAARSAGFVPEGVLRGYTRERDRRVDAAVLSLLPADLSQ